MVFFWAVSLLAALVGGYELVDSAMRATSAPQQAAGAAMALGITVIPYVFTRCLDAIVASSWRPGDRAPRRAAKRPHALTRRAATLAPALPAAA